MKRILYYLLLIACGGLIVYGAREYLLKPQAPVVEGDAPETPKEVKMPPAGTSIRHVTPWEEGKIAVKAVGSGAFAPAGSLAIKRVWGETAARKLALAQLAESIGGIVLNSKGTLHSAALLDHHLKEAVEAFVLGANELEPTVVEKNPDGSENYVVTMGVLMNGDNGLAKTLLPYLKRQEPEAVPYEAPKEAPAAKSDIRYSGLIVDARGVGALRPAMAPKLLLKDGRVAYGLVSVSNDFAQRRGLVDYAKSLDAARALAGRVGKTPLVVKAEAVQGVDLLVADATAAEIAHADALGNFLGGCKVVFVVD